MLLFTKQFVNWCINIHYLKVLEPNKDVLHVTITKKTTKHVFCSNKNTGLKTILRYNIKKKKKINVWDALYNKTMWRHDKLARHPNRPHVFFAFRENVLDIIKQHASTAWTPFHFLTVATDTSAQTWILPFPTMGYAPNPKWLIITFPIK